MACTSSKKTFLHTYMYILNLLKLVQNIPYTVQMYLHYNSISVNNIVNSQIITFSS